MIFLRPLIREAAFHWPFLLAAWLYCAAMTPAQAQNLDLDAQGWEPATQSPVEAAQSQRLITPGDGTAASQPGKHLYRGRVFMVTGFVDQNGNVAWVANYVPGPNSQTPPTSREFREVAAHFIWMAEILDSQNAAIGRDLLKAGGIPSIEPEPAER